MPEISRLLIAHESAVKRREDRMAAERRKQAADLHFEQRGRDQVGKPRSPTYGDDSWREQE
jgi:hypothetical protein